MDNLEVRSFIVRSVDTENRTIEGIAAPYDELFEAGDFNERFDQGVFSDFGSDANVRLYSEHDHLDKRAPIGMVTEGRNTGDGFQIRAHISETPKGNEVYQLLKDGVLRNFSVGFTPVESEYDEGTNTVTHKRAELKEVSVVAFPAYQSAQVLAVRDDSSMNKNEKGVSNETTMTENIEFASVADLDEVRNAVNEIDRKMAVAGEKKEDASSQFRSAGAFVKAHAEGNEAAVAEYRAYTGATTAKSHQSNGWLDSTLQIVNRGRPVVNLFTSGTLPASGQVVTYPYVSAITGAVASQVAEGDDLTQLDITVSTATAAVKTFGVKSDLSLQVIERSDVAYLDAVLAQQAASYAKITNDYTRTVMVAATPQTGSSFTLSSATAADFLKATAKGADLIDQNGLGLQADFVLVSSDVWLQAVGTASTGFAFDMNGDGGRTLGNADVPHFAGTLAGFPVVVDSGLAAKSMYVASKGAVTTWENAGAPIRLDALNPTNLSHIYSIYGFFAAGVVNANGLVKATVA